MSKLNVTPGEWKVVVNPLFQSIFRHIEASDKQIAEVKHYHRDIYPTQEEGEANAILIADAGTTYNKCGKLPSELMEENRELIEVLKLTKEFLEDLDKTYVTEYDIIDALLTKIENNQTPQP